MKPAADLMSNLSRKPYWRESDGQQVLELLASSGMTVSAFARQFGIGIHRIRYWSRRLKRGKAVGEVIPFYRVELKGGQLEESSSSRSRQGTGVELVLRWGCRVRLGCGFDSETLLRVVELLG